MFRADVERLACPECRASLHLTEATEGSAPLEAWVGDGGWIEAGLVSCAGGHRHPVIQGIPDFVTGRRLVAGELETREAFDWQWKQFREELKTWDFDPEGRVDLLGRELGLESPERLASLQGKIVFDAGCGNGVLSVLMALRCDATVIAMDFTTSVYRLVGGIARWVWDRHGNGSTFRLIPVRGDVHAPPVRDRSVDLLYSSGVLHHTPSTWRSAEALLATAAPGSSFYVFLYRWRPATILFLLVRPVVRVLPRFLKTALFWAMAIPYEGLKRSLNLLLGRTRYPHRNMAENVISLNDTFAPRYNHSHRVAECLRALRDQGFEDARVTIELRAGYGYLASGLSVKT